jgi:NADH:ubiquinone oxidoreductase subunit F (NADH-binding)
MTRRSFDVTTSALVRLDRAHRESGTIDVRALASELGRPAAALRGAAAFYAELHAEPVDVKVCTGTSCALAGAEPLQQALVADGLRCGTVYCVGHCNRSPAVLLADGRVVADVDPTTKDLARSTEPPRPDIRARSSVAIVTARIGAGDHSALPVARAAGVWSALPLALERSPSDIVDAIVRSGERGRGGAAFPTGLKWRLAARTPSARRFVVANGDEGDPGSFVDRVLMEDDPHAVLEGMAICARAIGADTGIVYIRAEYPRAQARMRAAIDEARAAGLLGDDILGTGFAFDVAVFPGMGSYVCGEETALLEAIEGRRGEVRLRPPYPAEAGLYGAPTVVNNVETFVNVPWIVAHGAEAYASLGTGSNAGTKAICLSAGFARPGIVEIELGTPLVDVVCEDGGGGKGGPLDAVLVGGPMGSVLVESEWDVPLAYDAMAARGLVLGHGGLVAVPGGSDWRALVVQWLRFMQHESCGRCVPCRLGSRRALDMLQSGSDRDSVAELLAVIRDASLCAFGQLIPVPLLQALERFGPQILAGRGVHG